ncbi:MAG: malonyl CoA-acyl carrier protein transacylase [Candidatus Binatia bacterium]|jgi:malonyl CoA-acyl carrier protein transacylase
MRVAVAFPGQGSQKKGMGQDFAAQFQEARETFDEASQALGFNLRDLCFEDDPRLALTEYQQPAILCVEVAMWRSLAARFGLEPVVLAGHSLGEYAALVVAGAVAFDKALALVRERGRLMQETVPTGEGAMLAIIAKPVNRDVVLQIAASTGVDLANDNAPDQVVISGAKEQIDAAVRLLKANEDFGRFKAIPLRVSAPFHSRMMQPAADKFRTLLDRSANDASKATIVASNATGRMHEGSSQALVDAMAGQIAGTVLWRDNMEILRASSLPVFEIGPGRPLRGFFAAAGISSSSISTVEQAHTILGDRLGSGSTT